MAGSARTQGYKVESAKTLATSFQTAAIDLRYINRAALIIKCANVTDNTGEFVLQIKIDDSDWTTLTSIPSMVLANTAATFVIDPIETAAEYMRIAFTAAGTIPDGNVTIHNAVKAW